MRRSTRPTAKLMTWADGAARLRVRANADQPDQRPPRWRSAPRASACAAPSTCSSAKTKIGPMREMIVGGDRGRTAAKALSQLLRCRRGSTASSSDGRPPGHHPPRSPPAHEFLPHDEAGVRDLAAATGKTVDEITRASRSSRSRTPCSSPRLPPGITYPEITEMQARAVFEAGVRPGAEGDKVFPEIMIPLVGIKKELDLSRRRPQDGGGGVRRKGRKSVHRRHQIEVPARQ